MNGEIDFEKVLEREFKGVQYIVTLKADTQGLTIEFENKYTGDIWDSLYEPQYIQQITNKAGSHKKYHKFVEMLSKALPENFSGDGYELFVDLLTHHDLQAQANRKSGGNSKTTDPKLMQKRYLILSYISAFDKAHYPIPLEYISNPEAQRSRLTIRRLGQQLQYLESNPTSQAVIKEFSALKHQNELIKSKLRAAHRVDTKQNHNNNTNKDTQQENNQLKQEIINLKSLREQQTDKYLKLQQEKDRKIGEIENKLKKHDQSAKKLEFYENKFNQIANEMKELASALQHSKQNQRKALIKIANLQKQLEQMIYQAKKGSTHSTKNNYLNSPKKSDNGSIKSGGSRKSIQSKSQKKITIRQNSTVFDSDTESSKIRRANNSRASPYRQSTRPLNSSNSAKNRQTQRINAINSKYSNISNLVGKDRNRSRSKSVKKQISPPSDNLESSAVMTAGYGSDNQEDNKDSEIMARLRNRHNKKLVEQKNKVKDKKVSLNPIQQKITQIANRMKAFRKISQPDE